MLMPYVNSSYRHIQRALSMAGSTIFVTDNALLVVPAIVGVPSSNVMLLTVTAPETVTVKGFVASVPAENKALLPLTQALSVLEAPTPPESVFQTLLLPLVSQVPIGVVPAPAVLPFVSHHVLV